MSTTAQRWACVTWIAFLCAFAGLHLLHLAADFPNHSPWMEDWAKYTDEGWYGNAAIRSHLFGRWYMPGDFNPAPAIPVWQGMEWLLFCFTGVSVQAARAMGVAFFFLDLIFAYILLRSRGPQWMALLAVTLAVTSPFLYAFSRLATLEPMITAVALAALILAERLPRNRHPIALAAMIGVLCTVMVYSKTTSVFLLPAIAWALVVSLRADKRRMFTCAAVAAFTSAVTFAGWLAVIVHYDLLRDFKYLLFINKYPKPKEFYWPLISFWWSFHGGLWADRVLIPLAGIALLAVLFTRRAPWSRRLRRDPIFGASLVAAAGYIFFMTYQNHPQPRYFTVVAEFSFFILAMTAHGLVTSGAAASSSQNTPAPQEKAVKPLPAILRNWSAALGAALIAGAAITAAFNAIWTLGYAVHPEYTWITAARELTAYIDRHPNGNRLLVSVSGDEITLLTHLPAICDDFGTLDLPAKTATYQPGWWATWNDIDPGTLEDLHTHFSLEQVARFRAFDHPERNVLVLFKLHPLPNGQVREPLDENLQVPLHGDTIDIPIQ